MLERLKALAPWAWLLSMLLLVGALLLAATEGRLRVNTDVLAMLPKDERRPEVERALQQLARAGDGRVIVLLRAANIEASKQAMDRFITELRESGFGQLRHQVDASQQGHWLDFFAAQRGGALLTAAQRQQLQSMPAEQLASQALAALMQPVGALRVGPWAEDPFNTLGQWLGERAQASPVRPIDGRLRVSEAGGHGGDWLLLMIDSPGSAFALRDNERVAAALARARAEVREARVYAAGLPLFAHAAATQAQNEMHVIGAGSLIGVFVLSWFAFARILPRLLVMLSIASGLAAAAAATWLVFGELHLITLVFGASLVGVAENYATSYYSARIAQPPQSRHALMRAQLPITLLALLTTLAGYALLAATPFPGLQQVALFSGAGLVAAFISTWLWFPHLDAGAVPLRPLTRSLGRLWAAWPALGARGLGLGALGLALLLAIGFWQGRVNDDIRLLQNSPVDLVQQQIEIGRRLDLPSPAQFFLLRADSEAALLEREEALKGRLLPLQAQGLLKDWQAVSDWVPSPPRQRQDIALVARRWAEVQPLLASQLGQPLPESATASQPLQLATWLAAPISEAARHQWLGRGADGRYSSVLMLRGVAGKAALPALAALADGDVIWVDKVAEVSELLQRQRQRMLIVLGAAVLAVALLLALRFRRDWWRALLPTLLAGATTLALLAIAQQPLQLFHVLALLLLLGVGVDYGIFLLAQPQRQELRGFVAVTLAAASTWLAFGLLALSNTPALRAFGLTLGLGILLAWWFTPFLIPDHETRNR